MSHRLSVQVLSRGFSSFIKARSLSYRFINFQRSYLPQRCYLTQGALSYSSNQYWTLHELVSQGRYSEAITLWEEEKSSGKMEEPSIYTAVMSLCEKIGSGEAAIAVREDLYRQGWRMDPKCAQHYLNALLIDGMKDKAMEFVQTCDIVLKENVEFIVEAAQSFHSHGYSSDACSLCHMDSTLNSPQLLAVELEILGSTKRYKKMWELIDKNYGEVASAPLSVQVALVHGLALADEYQKALDVIVGLSKKSGFDSTLTVKSIALLLESAKRAQDCKAGAEIYRELWKLACDINMFERMLDAPDTYSYLLRAINAAIHLQALLLKQYKQSRQETHKLKKFNEISGNVSLADDFLLTNELKRRKGWFIEDNLQAFMAQDFYKILKDKSLVPDRHTYEALLLMSCFSDIAMLMADQVLRLSLRSSGVEYLPSSFTSWTQHCGPVLPHQAARVIGLVRLHCHGYEIQLGLKEFEQLLDMEYDCGKNKKLEKEAADNVRMIKNMMETRGLLKSHEGWNLLFGAVSRLGNVGALITSYNDMQEQGIQPNLSTYHLIIDSLLATRNRKSITGVVFPLWRMIVQDYPRVQPDVDLMNKFIRSCRLSQYYERAFFFLTAMKDCNVAPNLETFKELFDTCHSEGNKEKFQMTVNMAKKVLPEQAADIEAIVAEYRQKWEANSDVALADKIIIQDSAPLSSEKLQSMDEVNETAPESTLN